MNMLISSGTKTRLRKLGITIASLTIVGEIVLAITIFAISWRFLAHENNSWLDAIYPLLCALQGLLTLLAWLSYKPLTSNDTSQQKSQTTTPGEDFTDLPTTSYKRDNTTRVYVPQDSSENAFSGAPEKMAENGERSRTILYSPRITTFTSYTVPKEGNVEERSQDKHSLNIKDPTRYSFAVADGVGGSFLPSMWAQIVAQRFVDLPEDFIAPQKFGKWLTDCRNEWDKWVVSTWIPDANLRRGTIYDWSRDRARGAETTLIGCSYSQTALALTGHTNILVTAIGDSVFFLVRPPSEEQPWWQHVMFPVINLEDFGPTPYTFDTASMDISRTWKRVKQEIFPAYPGDYIILSTDALAKWILVQIALGHTPWEILLSLIDYNSFLEFVHKERLEGTLDLDDTTMMAIPLQRQMIVI